MAPVPPTSLWAEALHAPTSSTIPERSDAVVVGAGVTGMLVATLLAEAGADVVVLDRDRVGGQATRNTTAKISCLQGTTLSSVESARGEEHAAAYAAANLHGLAGIRRLIEGLSLDCDLREAPAFTYAVT